MKQYLGHAAPAAHQQPAGEYIVAYALSAPEGWYDLAGEVLTWHPPATGATAHLRVFVRDAADDRPPTGPHGASHLHAGRRRGSRRYCPLAGTRCGPATATT